MVAVRRHVTEKTHAPDGSLTISELQRREDAWRDEQPATTRCAFCPWVFVGTVADGRAAADEHRREAHPEARRGRLAAEERRAAAEREAQRRRDDAARREQERQAAALEAMDDGEPQRTLVRGEAVGDEAVSSSAPTFEGELERASPSTSSRAGVGPGPKWTRESAIAAIRAFAADRGRPPTSLEVKAVRSIPSAATCKRIFGSWADAVEAAGFERPTRGRRASPLAGVAQPEREQPATTADDAGSTPAPRTDDASRPTSAAGRDEQELRAPEVAAAPTLFPDLDAIEAKATLYAEIAYHATAKANAYLTIAQGLRTLQELEQL